MLICGQRFDFVGVVFVCLCQNARSCNADTDSRPWMDDSIRTALGVGAIG